MHRWRDFPFLIYLKKIILNISKNQKYYIHCIYIWSSIVIYFILLLFSINIFNTYNYFYYITPIFLAYLIFLSLPIFVSIRQTNKSLIYYNNENYNYDNNKQLKIKELKLIINEKFKKIKITYTWYFLIIGLFYILYDSYINSYKSITWLGIEKYMYIDILISLFIITLLWINFYYIIFLL